MHRQALVLACCALACPLPANEIDPRDKSREQPPLVVIEPGVELTPTPPPPKRAREPVPPPDDPIDGRWPIRDFAVDIDAPEGTWLHRYHDKFGLQLAFGEGGPFRRNHSVMEIRTNCDGGCDPDEFDESVQNEKATTAFGLVKQPKVEWIVRPTKLREGAWWMHIRGLDDTGQTKVEHVDFAFMPRQSERGWLECVLRLEGPELARLDELTQWCRELKWKHVGENNERVEPRFGGRYHLETATLELPPIAGFRLEEYEPTQGLLRLTGEVEYIDTIKLGTTCQGTCSPELLEANLERSVDEWLASKSNATVEVPLQSPSPGLFRVRVRSSLGTLARLETHVTRIRPGHDRMFQCTIAIGGEAIARADELEAACTKALESLR